MEEKKEIVFLTSTFTVTVAFAAPDGEQVKSPDSDIVSLVTCEDIIAEQAYKVILIMYSGDGDRQAGGRAPFLELLFQLQSPAVHRKVQWLAGYVPEWQRVCHCFFNLFNNNGEGQLPSEIGRRHLMFCDNAVQVEGVPWLVGHHSWSEN